jgi:hypothetical protein
MPPSISKEQRIGINIRYNGYVHKGVGSLEHEGNDSVRIHVFIAEFPCGYRAEHGTDHMEFIIDRRYVIPDPTGANGWLSTTELNIDSFAPKPTVEEDIHGA